MVRMVLTTMGFPLVSRERVPGTLGNRRCSHMFLFLFLVPVRMPPRPYFLPWLKKEVPKKEKRLKIPAKKRCSWFSPASNSTALQGPEGGWRTMICSLYMVTLRQLGLLSNNQRSHNSGSTTRSGRCIFCRKKKIAQVWAFPLWQQYGLASIGHGCHGCSTDSAGAEHYHTGERAGQRGSTEATAPLQAHQYGDASGGKETACCEKN